MTDELRSVRRAAEKQAERARMRWGDDGLYRERTRKIIAERAERRRRPGGERYAELAELRRGTTSHLVVRDEYLVRADRLSDRERRRLPNAEAIPELDGRVVLVRSRQRPEGGKEHFAAPMGPVMKAVVGPEPVQRDAPAVPGAAAGAAPRSVAIIDTGITSEVRQDGWLTAVQRDTNIDLLDDLPPEGRLDIGAGHGTFAAGIVQRVAPGAVIRAYRALDSDGFGTELAVARAMVRAAQENEIINLSLGLQTDDDEPPVALEVAVELIRQRWPKVLIVAAAGNFGDERPCWPAALPGVTAVAALDRQGTPARWSSRGPWVDCCTIGEAVLSTFVQGRERDDVDDDVDADVYPRQAWAVWSGTSFAAPQVAGAVAHEAMTRGIDVRDAFALLRQGKPSIPGGLGPRIDVPNAPTT